MVCFRQHWRLSYDDQSIGRIGTDLEVMILYPFKVDKSGAYSQRKDYWAYQPGTSHEFFIVDISG
jgi:hypothetical protein